MKDLKSKISLFLVPLLFIGVALFSKVYVLNDHKNGVSFFKEISRPGYEASPAYYTVNPSPAKAWEMTHKTPGGRTLDAIAVITFWVAIALLVLSALDVLPLQPGQATVIVVLLLAIWGALKYGSHSAALDTTVIVSPQQYDKAKASPEGLDGLFDSIKPL